MTFFFPLSHFHSSIHPGVGFDFRVGNDLAIERITSDGRIQLGV